MTKNLKLFLIFFLLFFVSGWGINALDRNMTAQVSQTLLDNNKVPDNTVPDLEIGAGSALSIFLKRGGARQVLFEKNADEQKAVGSLTKLMTAKIVLENYNPNQTVKFLNKQFRAIDLLYPLLIESNNGAASSLTEVMGHDKFVELMNSQAKSLGMRDTKFLNPAGLDQPGQYSTARDLVKLAEHLIKEKSFMWNILSLARFDLYSANGEFIYSGKSTNELLGKIPLIIGGKTGETPQAGGCLLLVLEAPDGQGYLVNVILNSQDRFGETEKLIEWAKSAYVW
jgi:serine-type D-Ala-D-Ala carboxypeptidase (penicillin-binding protein 5/6)